MAVKMKAYKRELTAQQITKDALLILRSNHCNVWRQQNGTYGNRKNIATPGIPDIIGFTNNGLFLGCEVKKIGDKFSKEQIEFLQRLRDWGGTALYATEENGRTVIKNFDGDRQLLKKAASLKSDLF